MYLIETVVLSTVTAFSNYSVSESVDIVGKFETTGGAIRSCTDSRYPYETMITAEV